MRAQADSLDCVDIPILSSELDEMAPRKPIGVLCMDEAEFRAFYEKTAPQLRAYLRRVTGDAAGTAEDLLQESYLRLLRAPLALEGEDHRRHYLFRIATNLLHDQFRAGRSPFAILSDIPSGTDAARDFELARDLQRILEQLKPRDRALLWLAYAEGFCHEEIAKSLRCTTSSIRPMLFRARQRLARLLRAHGWKPKSRGEVS